MALRNHPLLQAATYEAEAANQVTREEKSAYYPTASGKPHGGRGHCPTAALPQATLNNPLILNRESNGLEVQPTHYRLRTHVQPGGLGAVGSEGRFRKRAANRTGRAARRQSRLLRRPARRGRTQGCGGNGEGAPDSCRSDHHAREEQAEIHGGRELRRGGLGAGAVAAGASAKRPEGVIRGTGQRPRTRQSPTVRSRRGAHARRATR